jgi:hypothetical protein
VRPESTRGYSGEAQHASQHPKCFVHVD